MNGFTFLDCIKFVSEIWKLQSWERFGLITERAVNKRKYKSPATWNIQLFSWNYEPTSPFTMSRASRSGDRLILWSSETLMRQIFKLQNCEKVGREEKKFFFCFFSFYPTNCFDSYLIYFFSYSFVKRGCFSSQNIYLVGWFFPCHFVPEKKEWNKINRSCSSSLLSHKFPTKYFTISMCQDPFLNNIKTHISANFEA